ncbi:hypothetical protein CPC08DRAFT_764343 [Agrocybe pediades]|nr:hypothetical protein CPC08DRAFT_764343 [Agrocybe pediades]
MVDLPHPELQALKTRLQQIYEATITFKPLTARPPILDSSYDAETEDNDDNQWLRQENVPGLKKLGESIKIDLGVLEKFLDNPNCANLPPLSTNAPYLIAVWNEVVCAPPPTVSVFKTFYMKPAVVHDKKARASQQQSTGVKVDIVADNGRQWIRVNTVKNSRILSEFREIDSYLTDSDEDSDGDWDDVERPSLAQTEFDNSILRMGRSLLEAAQANPIEGTNEIPKVTLRLTRLDPNLLNEDGTPPDPRIAQTIDTLRDIGVQVALGERTEEELEQNPTLSNSSGSSEASFIPTANINLDLSVLIALISDLTHAALPDSVAEANKRFVPPLEYREWKQKRQAMIGKPVLSSTPSPSPALENDINDLPRDLIKHSRALTNQLLQEMTKGMLQEIYDRTRLPMTPDGQAKSQQKIVFWTTSEARERCLRIVSKIGGVYEKRRARALFCLSADDDDSPIPLQEAERLYWQDSRYPLNFIPFLPIRIFPRVLPDQQQADVLAGLPVYPKTNFSVALQKVASYILSEETVPHPRAIPEDTLRDANNPQAEIQRATVTKANPRLTTHTAQSMLWGAMLGWTTLTANRTSVKAILRELKAARVAGRLAGVSLSDEDYDKANVAAMWVVDPRSLAEGMSSAPFVSR